MPPPSTVMTIGSAIALGLVMCLHVPTLPKHGLFDWGVPWFFFASGYWFRYSSFLSKLRERARTLLLPYFLWNLIWFPILFAGNWLGWRYCGVLRVVDGSPECVLRCIGLSPFAWPALVPTWFLRALFVVSAVVGTITPLNPHNPLNPLKPLIIQALLPLLFWTLYGTRSLWCPADPRWTDFFTFGLSLQGCAWFATGIFVRQVFSPASAQTQQPSTPPAGNFLGLLRRQLMPVYILHAAVIVSVGWIAKALGLFGYLATIPGDIVMWFVGIAGSIAIAEALRRLLPRTASLLFGGR